MIVGIIAKQALRALHVLKCTHEWVRFSDTEDQCQKCGAIATEEAKKNLERLKKRPLSSTIQAKERPKT